MALVDLDQLERLYERQHSGRYRADPQLEAALDLVDAFPTVVQELRALRRVAFHANQVRTVLQSRDIAFPALANLDDALNDGRLT
jgi:hypothetical protein